MPKRDGSPNVLKDKDFIRDYEHIKEDAQDLLNEDFSEKMSDTDMEAYYFQLHDLDQNGKLDGLEILGAFHHIYNPQDEEIPEDYFKDGKSYTQGVQDFWNEKFEGYAEMIDDVFKEEDLDEDGYLSYLEFALGREKEQMKA